MNAETRYKMLMDSVSDYAVFFTDCIGTINEWSTGAERVLGFTEEEVLGKNIDVVFTPETKHMATVERVVATREGQAVDERWHLKKGGVRFFALGRLLALKDDAGTVQGFAKILRDWTTQKEAEEALKTSNERFRAFFDLAGSGNLEIDAESLKIISANPRICEMLGYSQAELTELLLTDIVHPEDRASNLQHVRELRAGTTRQTTSEKRYVRKEGETIWVFEAFTLLPTHGKPPCLLAVVQEITVLKAQEQELERRVADRTRALEEKSAQVEEMCYTVAHDLRAPLRSVIGYAGMLLEESSSLSEEAKLQNLQRIRKSAAQLDRLILDLLGFNRVQQVALVEEQVMVRSALDIVLEEIDAEIRQTGTKVWIDESLGIVHADRFSLEHILRNFMTNALKFTRPGTAPLIRVYSEFPPNAVRIIVEDNGIGVPPAFHRKIFGMFEKLPTAQSHLGTGVGLAIVSKLSLRLGGRCGVSQNPIGGSRFWVELPAWKEGSAALV